LPEIILNSISAGRKKKEGDQKQDGKKAYSERWKKVAYELETRMSDLVGDWVSKDVAIHHRTTAYIGLHK
jgi:hypothetical protein